MKTTIKTTVSEQKEVEREIKLPFYSKEDGGGFYFKILTELYGVRVYFSTRDDSPPHSTISISEYVIPDALKATPCTEKEFNLAYNTAKAIIETEINKL